MMERSGRTFLSLDLLSGADRRELSDQVRSAPVPGTGTSPCSRQWRITSVTPAFQIPSRPEMPGRYGFRTPSSCWCALLGTLAAAITNRTPDLDRRHREGPVDSPCPLPLTADPGPSAHEPAGARVGVISSTFPFVHDRQESSGDSWRTRHGSWGGVPSKQPLQETPTDVGCSTTPEALCDDDPLDLVGALVDLGARFRGSSWSLPVR